VIPSLEELTQMWETVFILLVREAIIEQGSYVLDFLGVGGNLEMTTDPAVKYLREDSVELVKEINTTTRNKLRKTLAVGFEDGESISQLSNRVQDVFKDATRNRADMIARTESIRATNFGTLEAYRQSEVVEAQEWLAERDDRTCPYCLEMDGKVTELDKAWFKKGESLTVDGNTLDFDLLDVDTPPLHPQCRCTLIPVLLGEKAEKKVKVKKKVVKKPVKKVVKKSKSKKKAVKEKKEKKSKGILGRIKDGLEKPSGLDNRIDLTK